MAAPIGPRYSKDNEDDGVVDFEEDDQEEAALEYDDDDPNLVFVFSESEEGKEHLRDLARRIRDRFDTAWDASEPYRERFAKDWKLLECELDKRKGGEFEMKPHLPITLKNVTRLAFRAESELFGDWSRPVSYAPVGESPHDAQLAEARTKHTSFQFREQIPDFQRQMARGLMAFFFAGEVVGKSYRDVRRGHNRHEVLTPDEFVMPYMYASVMPDLSDAPWYAQVLRLYEHDLVRHEEDWFGVDEVLRKKRPTWDTEPEQPLRKSIGEREGQTEEAAKDDAPFKFIQYEGWEVDLPGQDEPRWIQAILDYDTGNLLLMRIYEEPSLQELDRFDRETRELQEHRTAVEHHETMLATARANLEAASANGLPVMPEDQMAMGTPPPAPPPWMPPLAEGETLDSVEPTPPRREPIFMFWRAVNIENLAGNHGIGHGRMQAHYNRIGNTALREYTDAALAANIPSWLIDNRVVINEGKTSLTFAPGSLNKTELNGAMSLRDAVMPFPAPAANPQLVDLAKMMDELAQEAAQSPDVLSGEPGKSGETFRGLSSRVEQAVKQLSIPTGRFASALRQIAKNNAMLNAIFLEDEEVIAILDPQSQKYEMLKVGRSLYESGAYDATVTSDLSFKSKRERIAEADEIIAMGKALPPQLLMGNNGAIYWWYQAVKRALEARGMYDLVPALGPAPPKPTTPFGLPPPPPPGTVPPGAGGPPPPPGNGSPAGGNPPAPSPGGQ